MPKLPPKRPSLYDDPKDLIDYFYSYLWGVIDEGKAPTIEGMTAFCFFCDSSRYKYEKIDSFKEVFEHIYSVMADETINSKHIDSQLKKQILQAKYNYRERQDVDITSNNITVSIASEKE